MRALPLLLLPLLVFSCSSGEDTPSTSSVSSSTGGSSGNGGDGGTSAGGSSSGAGGASAGSGGAAGSVSAGQGGAGQGGAGQGGAGGGGTGGSGQAGTSGGDCCAAVKCGGANPICVEGACFDLAPGQCFSDADCGGKPCVGATVCPCDALCDAPTTPGTCKTAPPGDWANCGVPGDCVLQANSCCGVCGAPTLADVDAVHQGKTKEHFDAVCPEPGPCPACASMTNPDLMAVCAPGKGKCVAQEISKSFFSFCEKDEDCLLRVPQCCSCGQMPKEQLVAIHQAQNGAFMSELGCDLVDCAPCVDPPTPPDGVKAVCDPQTKHCRVSP